MVVNVENIVKIKSILLLISFQRRQYAPIQIFKTKNKGLGLRSKKNVKKYILLTRGSFIIEYCGEVLSQQIFQKRIMEHSKKGAKHFYFMSLKANEVLTV